MYPKKEMTTSLDMRENNPIQKNTRDPRPSMNEDVLKGLRLSGNEEAQKARKLGGPPQHMVHQNTLMGDVRISDRNLNDSEIEDLKKELSKLPSDKRVSK